MPMPKHAVEGVLNSVRRAADRLKTDPPSRFLLRLGRSCGRSGVLLHHVVMMMAPHVVMMMYVHMVMMMHRHLRFFWRVGDRLHGHLGDRRSPYERRDCERRNGNAWKLHVVSLVR